MEEKKIIYNEGVVNEEEKIPAVAIQEEAPAEKPAEDSMVHEKDGKMWVRVTYKGKKVVGEAVEHDTKRNRLKIILHTMNKAVVYISTKKNSDDRFATKFRQNMAAKNKKA